MYLPLKIQSISVIATFIIEEENKKKIIFNPELRIFNQPFTVTSEADIKTNLYTDKFLVMNLVKGNDYYNIRYQTKPFMIWIWLSTILLAIGGFISLYKRKQYEK